MFGPDGVNEKTWAEGAGSAAQRHLPHLRWGRHQPADPGTGRPGRKHTRLHITARPPAVLRRLWPSAAAAGRPRRTPKGRHQRPRQGARRPHPGQRGSRHVIGSFTLRPEWRPEGWRHLPALPDGRPPGRPSTRASSPSQSRTRKPASAPRESSPRGGPSRSAPNTHLERFPASRILFAEDRPTRGPTHPGRSSSAWRTALSSRSSLSDTRSSTASSNSSTSPTATCS